MTFIQLASRGIGFTVEPWKIDPKTHVKMRFSKEGYRHTTLIVRVKTLIYSKYEEARLCGLVIRSYLGQNQEKILLGEKYKLHPI